MFVSRTLQSASRIVRSSHGITPCRAFSFGSAIRALFKSNKTMPAYTDTKWCAILQLNAASASARWDSNTVALVTGSNKGIGFAIAKLFAEEGISVVVAARNADLGNAAVAKLKEAVPEATATFCQLDITDASSISSCAAQIKQQFGKLDILVNNAGIAYKGSTFGAEEAATTMACNVKGTRGVCEAMLPLLKEAGNGRIVNLCSRAGMLRQLSSPELREAFVSPESADAVDALADSFVDAIRSGTHQSLGWSNSMYGVSKLAEISYTRWLAAQLKPEGIAVYACCPGYVVTDMTSGRGAKMPEEGADTPVWLSLQPIGSIPQGGFFGERQEINWAA